MWILMDSLRAVFWVLPFLREEAQSWKVFLKDTQWELGFEAWVWWRHTLCMFQKILSGSQSGLGPEKGTWEEPGLRSRRGEMEPYRWRGAGETDNYWYLAGKENAEWREGWSPEGSWCQCLGSWLGSWLGGQKICFSDHQYSLSHSKVHLHSTELPQCPGDSVSSKFQADPYWGGGILRDNALMRLLGGTIMGGGLSQSQRV